MTVAKLVYKHRDVMLVHVKLDQNSYLLTQTNPKNHITNSINAIICNNALWLLTGMLHKTLIVLEQKYDYLFGGQYGFFEMFSSLSSIVQFSYERIENWYFWIDKLVWEFSGIPLWYSLWSVFIIPANYLWVCCEIWRRVTQPICLQVSWFGPIFNGFRHFMICTLFFQLYWWFWRGCRDE